MQLAAHISNCYQIDSLDDSRYAYEDYLNQKETNPYRKNHAEEDLRRQLKETKGKGKEQNPQEGDCKQQ